MQTISRLLEEMEGGLTSLPAFLLLPRPQGAELRYRNHAKHNLYNLYKKIPNKHLLTVKGNCYLRATAVCNYKQILLKSNYKYIKISNYLLICLQCKHGFLHPYSCFKFRKHVLERPGVYNKSMPQLSTVEFSESGTFFTWQDHVS